MFFKTGVLKKFAIFTGKHLRWSLLLITLTAKQCFPEYIEKFLRTGVLIEYLRWLLLQVLCKKAAPKISQTSLKLIVIGILFIKLQAYNLQPCENRRSGYRCFAVNFAKFFKTILCRRTLNSCS